MRKTVLIGIGLLLCALAYLAVTDNETAGNHTSTIAVSPATTQSCSDLENRGARRRCKLAKIFGFG